MDVTILEAENPPAKPVVAIHAGSVRRQVRMEVNRTFQIPHSESASCVSVTLFEAIASQTMPMDDGSKEMSIPVRDPSGNNSEVKMSIRHCGAGAESRPRPAGQNKLEDARDYLAHHQLQQRIQDLIQDVLRAQPEDPYRYMLQCLKTTKGEPQPPALPSQSKPSDVVGVPELKATLPEPEKPSAPLIPKPPAKPPPAGGAPRKAGSFTKQQGSGGGGASPKGSAESRKEAKVAARASISMVLGMPQCAEKAESSFREKAQGEMAKKLAGDIIGMAKLRIMNKVISSQDVRTQARASIRAVFEGSAGLLSSEYRQGVTRWTVALALRSAANLIGADESRRQECFGSDRHVRHMSMPTPIVFLASDSSSWGAWCSGKA